MKHALLLALLASGCKCASPAAPASATLLSAFDGKAEMKKLQGTWSSDGECVERFDGDLLSRWCGNDEPIVTRFGVPRPSRISSATLLPDGGSEMTVEYGYALESGGLRTWSTYSGVRVGSVFIVPTFSKRGVIAIDEKSCRFHDAVDHFDVSRGVAAAGTSVPCKWETTDAGRSLTLEVSELEGEREIRLTLVGSSLIPEVALPGLMKLQGDR